MALITSAAQLQDNETVRCFIYGQSGAGKTSLALSAPNPVLLDFDQGYGRPASSITMGKACFQVDSWDEAKAFIMGKDVEPFETVICDTVYAMIEAIKKSVNPTTGEPANIKQWGQVASEFRHFVDQLKRLGKHVVFLDQVKDDGESGAHHYAPASSDKRVLDIVQNMDLVGYLYMGQDSEGNQQRQVTFTPTSWCEGKNIAYLPDVLAIPEVVDNRGRYLCDNTFFADSIIKPYRDMRRRQREEAAQAAEVMTKIRAEIDGIKDAKGANDFVATVNSYPHIGTTKTQARVMLQEKVAKLGLKWDKKTKSYAGA